MSVGSRIKERRESLGLTQIQLANLLGVTKGAIGNYETDANSPKASILYKVFNVLKCDANYLFQDEMQETEERFSLPEIKIIKKYRLLDQHGQKAVDSVLDVEYERCSKVNDKNNLEEMPYVARSGERGTITKSEAELDEIFSRLTPDTSEQY